MALIVCRAVGMLLGLCSRSGSVLGLTLRREMLCKSEGGTLAPLCDSAVLCSLPPGWGGVGTARSLLLYVKVMQKSQTTLCLAWLQGTVLLFGKEILVNVLLFFFCYLWHLSRRMHKGLSSLWRLTWAEAQKYEQLSHDRKGLLHFLHH